MNKFCLSLITLGILIPSLTWADDSADPCCGVKIFGYLDGSYNYLASQNQFISGVFDRAFDIEENGFTLQQAALYLAYQPERGFGGLANVILGQDALITAAYGFNPDIGSEHVGIDIVQAYGQFAIRPLTLMAGKFVTLAGAEVIDSLSNTQFSRSLLFTYAIPFTHLGFRGTYVVNDKLKLIAGVNDGWDTIRDVMRDKTIELGIAYTPTTQISLSAQGYSGEEREVPRSATGPTGRRNVIDIVANYQANEKITVVANYDFGNQSSIATWQGIAVYWNYKFDENWRLSLRGEDFYDPDGYRTGVEQTVRELTFTVGYAPIKMCELRGEIRRDISNVESYLDKETGTPRKFQQSYALEGICKFSNREII